MYHTFVFFSVTRQRLSLQGFRMASSLAETSKIATRYHGSETSIWVLFDILKAKYAPLDLAGGFATFSPRKEVTDALKEAASIADWSFHQYPSSAGADRLIKAVGSLYSPLVRREINDEEVIITYGAQEAINCSILSLVNPGDEVILIEPKFNCYSPLVRSAGGIVRGLPLKFKPSGDLPKSSDWILDYKELEDLFNSNTKMILFNSPQNPTGKVFSEEECTVIADLCKKWGVICVSDEVYEWMVHKPNKMFKIATLPGMWDQTITIGSAGKAFHVTGWKIGWAYGPANLIRNLRIVHQHSVFSVGTPLQEAVAICLEKEMARINQPDCIFARALEELTPKRDFIVEKLKELGMKPVIPDGGYFILADFSSIMQQVDLSQEKEEYCKDFKLSMWMMKNVKVQVVPCSSFFSQKNKHLGEDFLRFCFMREQETLEEGMDILKKWKLSLK